MTRFSIYAISDEIHFPPPKPPVYNILGGAGTYSALGARLLSPPPLSKYVGWIVDAGSDFPSEIRQTIISWNTDCNIRETPDRLTTRGWNRYGPSEERAFKYLTPKLRLDHSSLNSSHLRASSFHLICNPTRCIDLVTNIMTLRQQIDPISLPPIFIWEPVPDLCVPEQLDDCFKALSYVHIVSPNHTELGAFFSRDTTLKLSGEADESAVEELSERFLQTGIGPNKTGSVVVRCGRRGCYLAQMGMPITERWLPAFHASGMTDPQKNKVVDPTGGGNAFLGGLAVGMVRNRNESVYHMLREAAIWGTVAASFAIEQVGMPTLGQNETGETWNGVQVEDRVEDYKRRLRVTGLYQERIGASTVYD